MDNYPKSIDILYFEYIGGGCDTENCKLFPLHAAGSTFNCPTFGFQKYVYITFTAVIIYKGYPHD